MKNIILIISTIFALYILICLCFIIKFKIQNLKLPLLPHQVFTYDYNKLCQAPFEFNNESLNSCKENVFNGFQTIILNWSSNQQKDKYLCYYFYLASNYLKNNELYWSINYWLTIYDKVEKETIGTARWSNCWKSFLRKNNTKKTKGKANVPFFKSKVTATSGLLEKYQNANIIVDFTEDIRKIYIYIEGTYVNEKYEAYRKKNLLEKKLEN